MNSKIIVLVAIAFALGCSSEANNGNNGSTTGSNNGSSNNGANNGANNGSNNGANNGANNGSNNGANNGANNGGGDFTEPYVATFQYVIIGKPCPLLNCDEGFEIGLVSGSFDNLQGQLVSISNEDRLAFANTFMTPAFMTQMKDGFGCPDGGGDADAGADAGDAGGDIDDLTYRFEVRIRENGGELNRYPQDITGCFEANDPAVIDVITELEVLGEKYL